MPPPLALFLTVAFVVVLYVRGFRAEEKGSGALWLPVTWIMITGSRFVSQWLSLGSSITITNGAEGSPIDAAVFAGLILAGTIVLIRRNAIARFVQKNPWLVLFIVYSLLSIAWSDFPEIAIKRWIKTLGHPVMALVILSDPKPMNALRIVMKRCAFVLIPFSITMIKYYPQYSQGYDAWTGRVFYGGVAVDKNFLGLLCTIFGNFFVWSLLTRSSIADRRARREQVIIASIFLLMIFWLLSRADSSTSLATLILGSTTMVVLGSSKVNKRHLGIYVFGIIAVVLLAEMGFGLSAEIIRLLGRDPTLTDRTFVWHDALSLQPNPLLGAGFESFWLGPRLEAMWAKWTWRPIQAHNGYIEIYLNLGIVGVSLLAAIILATYGKIARQFLSDPDFARLRLGYLFAFLAHNITEATFVGVHLVWTMFYIIAIEYQGQRLTEKTPAAERRRPLVMAPPSRSVPSAAGPRPGPSWKLSQKLPAAGSPRRRP
ncbi:MAG: O-antigen ligase family protein [Rhodospirillales bacterium]